MSYILCPYTESQSFLPRGSILVPLNPTTLTKIGLSGILIIRRQFGSGGSRIRGRESSETLGR